MSQEQGGKEFRDEVVAAMQGAVVPRRTAPSTVTASHGGIAIGGGSQVHIYGVSAAGQGGGDARQGAPPSSWSEVVRAVVGLCLLLAGAALGWLSGRAADGAAAAQEATSGDALAAPALTALAALVLVTLGASLLVQTMRRWRARAGGRRTNHASRPLFSWALEWLKKWRHSAVSSHSIPRRPALSRMFKPGVGAHRSFLIAAKTAVHALALTPLAILSWQFWRVFSEADIDALGADPVAEIEHRLGIWALRLLLVTLAITPLRQLTGQPVLIRFRRMLGLYVFAYASLHFATYLALDLRGYWTLVFEEIVKRPYITVGFAAWLLLVPLAITSTKGWMRRLARNWGRLHRLVYAVAVLAVLHFWWIVKSDIREPLLYAAILAALLGWRLWRLRRNEKRVAGSASG